MRRSAVFLIIIMLLPLVSGQNIHVWIREYGVGKNDMANAVAVAENGDVIIAGAAWSFSSGYDFWVLRLDPDGNVKWQRTYGGSDRDVARAVAVTKSGDVIVVGETSSFGMGYSDFWVLKLDGNGNIIWQKTYGKNGPDVAKAVALAENGDIIVGGTSSSFGAGDQDFWILRLDSRGNVKWQKTYGGPEDDDLCGVAVASNGDIIAAGTTESFGTGKSDFWVLRLNGEGKVEWQRAYGGVTDDMCRGMVLTPDGNVVLAGETVTYGDWADDARVLLIDGNGNMRWHKLYGGGYNDGASGVAVMPSGNIAVVGHYQASGERGAEAKLWLFMLAPTGNYVWSKVFRGITGHPESAVTSAPNGDVVAVGYTESIWGIRLPPSGRLPMCQLCTDVDIHTADILFKSIPTNANVKETKSMVTDTDVRPSSMTMDVLNTLYGPGILNIRSNPPSAGVYIDGEYVGDTPISVSVLPGEHRVEVTKPGYSDYVKDVNISPLTSETLNASLEPVEGVLRVNSEPSGAEVYINGEHSGKTPLSIELSPGRYNVTLKKEGYREYTTRVEVKAGEITSINAKLEKRTETQGASETTNTSTPSSSSTSTTSKNTTVTSTPTKTTSTSQQVKGTKETSGEEKKSKGICGPALLMALALLPALRRKG